MEQLISKLESLGFSRLDATIYMHLLRNNSLTASEVSKIAGVNRSQIYDVLSKLIAKGICTNIRGTVKKYCPVDPQKVLEDLRKELDFKDKLIQEVDGLLAEEYTLNSDTNNSLEFLHVLNAPNSIKAKVEELELTMHERNCCFNKPPYSVNKRCREYYEIPSELPRTEIINLGRGIEYRALYEAQPSHIPDFIDKLQRFESAGEKVKITKRLPFKMFVFDRKTVMFALRNFADTPSDCPTFVFEHSEYAESMIEIFDIYWDRAMTIDEYITRYNKESQ